MGSITPYETSAGRRYRVRYRKPDHAQTDKRGFRTKRDAELFLASIEVRKATGAYIDPSLSRVTVASLSRAFLAKKERALKPSSFAPLAAAWRVHVEPRWGKVEIRAIRPSDVEEWVRQLGLGIAENAGRRKIADATPRSATVVIRAVGVLAGILDTAVKDGRIPKNPARGIDNLPRKSSEKPRVYLSHTQVASLVRSIEDDNLALLVLLLAYTGLRWGEAIALRPRDVDFDRHRISIVRSATQVDGYVILGTPKSWERRSVPLPTIVGGPIRDAIACKSKDSLIFERRHGGFLGRPHHRENNPSWFAIALANAGLEYMTPHDLRHTAASLAVSAGANIKVLQKMLGHKSAAMTLDVYADLFDEDLDMVAVRLDEAAAKLGTIPWNRQPD
jgi:integrase